jgi:hypothetical protein
MEEGADMITIAIAIIILIMLGLIGSAIGRYLEDRDDNTQ